MEEPAGVGPTVVRCFLEAYDAAVVFPLELSLTSSWYDFLRIASSSRRCGIAVLPMAFGPDADS